MSELVSFIIPALNEQRHIGDCIRSILLLQRPSSISSTEIIVVDNMSSDRTAEIGQSLGARVVPTLPGSPSRARNLGANVARGAWLAFVDADCVLETDWLIRCMEHFRSTSDTVAIGGVMKNPAADATWVELAWYALAYRQSSDVPKLVRWLPTFNLLVRRSAFDAIHGFDEKLVTCEDCDFGYRLANCGRLFADPQIRVVHLGESKSLVEVFRREAWRTKGNVLLARRRPTDVTNWISLLFPLAVLLAGFLILIGLVTAWVHQRVLWPWWLAAFGGLTILTMIVFRKSRSKRPLGLAKQLVVFITYLAGRTAGLAWSFQRVQRKR